MDPGASRGMGAAAGRQAAPTGSTDRGARARRSRDSCPRAKGNPPRRHKEWPEAEPMELARETALSAAPDGAPLATVQEGYTRESWLGHPVG